MRSKIVFLLCLVYLNAQAQRIDYLSKFENTLSAGYSEAYSQKRISSKSTRGNSIFFLEIGYYLNSNNMLGKQDISYKVIQNIIESSTSHNNQYRWIVKDVSPQSRNFSQKGKEFPLYEGYLFRYIAEFQYLYPNKILYDPHFARSNFLKWYNRSLADHGDASSLYGLRLHIGSHWATTAAYLLKIDSENARTYASFIDLYDKQLKKSLKIVNVRGNECYIWNSTYNDRFTNVLKKRKKEAIIQDVSHGNHIVQYVVDSYKLGSSSWTKKDLERFANTLKFIIWQDRSKPSDNVDGTYDSETKVSSGWKQTDGWMKLMNILDEKQLFEIYDSFYNTHSRKLNTNYPYLQYYANMAIFQKNNTF